MSQRNLFATPVQLPPGFLLRPDFIQPEEEAQLLREIGALDLRPARYKQFTARRRILSYGGSYDFSSNVLMEAEAVPPFLFELRARIAALAELASRRFQSCRHHGICARNAAGLASGRTEF